VCGGKECKPITMGTAQINEEDEMCFRVCGFDINWRKEYCNFFNTKAKSTRKKRREMKERKMYHSII